MNIIMLKFLQGCLHRKFSFYQTQTGSIDWILFIEFIQFTSFLFFLCVCVFVCQVRVRL